MRILLLLVSILLSQSLDAQILKRIIDRASDKIEDAAAEKAAEIIADQVTRAMNKKVDEVYGDWVREAAKQDSIERVNSGDTVDWERAGSNMMDFLKGMNNAADLRDQYEFNLYMAMEMESEEEKSISNFHFNTESPMIMVENPTENGKNFIIIDLVNDATLMLMEDEDGKKRGQALPNMSGLVRATQSEEFEVKSIKKGSGKKTIAGYSCQEYKGDSKDYLYTYYVTKDLPIPDFDEMRDYMKRFNPYINNEEFDKIEGWPMQTIMRGKKKSKQDVTTTVMEVSDKKISIDRSDYSFDGSYADY